MSGWTNKGKYRVLDWVFCGTTIPTNFYVVLVTDEVAPTAETDVLDELTEIANGNGYTTGGYELTPGETDFDVLTEDDVEQRALVQITDVVWTAAGVEGIPVSGDGASYAVLTDDNLVVADREVLFYWDLKGERSVSDEQTLTLEDTELRIDEPAE